MAAIKKVQQERLSVQADCKGNTQWSVNQRRGSEKHLNSVNY